MTFIVSNFIPSNLQAIALYEEMADNIQFILGKGEIKLSTTYDNAIADVTIDITDAGTGTHTLRNSLANQTDTFTIDIGADVLSLTTFLDLEVGTKVRLTNSGGVLPSGLAIDTDYFVAVTLALGRYIDIRNKYRDFLSLDNEIVQKIISEQGYDYISSVLELMTVGNVESKVFLGYIGLVHFLKGNRRGLELVFGLLKLDYTLTEWWEKSPQGTPDTYDLTVNVDMTKYTFEDVDAFDTGIQAFVAQYVYPIFDTYAINATLRVQSPFYIGTSAFFGEEINVLPPAVGLAATQDPAPYVAPILITSETITVNPP